MWKVAREMPYMQSIMANILSQGFCGSIYVKFKTLYHLVTSTPSSAAQLQPAQPAPHTCICWASCMTHVVQALWNNRAICISIREMSFVLQPTKSPTAWSETTPRRIPNHWHIMIWMSLAKYNERAQYTRLHTSTQLLKQRFFDRDGSSCCQHHHNTCMKAGMQEAHCIMPLSWYCRSTPFNP